MIQPTFDRVLVRRDAPRTTTEGGLVIADQSQEAPGEGTIVGMGPDVDRNQFALGLHVSFGKYSGFEHLINAGTDAAEKLLTLKQDEIITVERDVEDATDEAHASPEAAQ